MDSDDLPGLFLAYARTHGGGTTRYGILSRIFEQAWCKESASLNCQDDWSPRNPAWGQCAVTALVVQEMCGGWLMKGSLEKYGSHYWNRLPNGEGFRDYDLTWRQFPSGTAVPVAQNVERSYALDSERALAARTRERYELLKKRVIDVLRSA